MLGELIAARTYLEQGAALYDPQMHPHITLGLTNPRLDCLFFASMVLWHLGYPEQALQRSQEAVALAEGMSYPFSLAGTLAWAAVLHLHRREEEFARERAEAVIALSTEQGFPFWLALGTRVRGWALAAQGQVQEGLAQIYQSPGSILLPYVLAETHGKAGQIEEGLSVTAEALAFVDRTGVYVSEAELYRVKGELTLRYQVHSPQSKVEEAEKCFHKALEIAQNQKAKSLELRTATSLARLWQRQGKRHEAHTLLSEVYTWFTEGFDTKDLQEAKALLKELS
jgi:predicted ATPase